MNTADFHVKAISQCIFAPPTLPKKLQPWVQRDGGAIAGAIDGAIAPNAPAWLRARVQDNFRLTLLVPSREEPKWSGRCGIA